jgi:hypothetical protein
MDATIDKTHLLAIWKQFRTAKERFGVSAAASA